MSACRQDCECAQMSKSDLEMISQRVYCSCFGHNHLRHERSPSGTSWYSIPIFLAKTLGWSIGGKTASDWASAHRRCQYSNRPGTWRNKPPWRILFFGTDDFSLHTLQVLSNSRTRLVDTLEVVTKKKSPIEAYAQRNGLLTYHWPVPVTAGRFDVGVLVSFGKLIPQNVIKMFPYGIVNIHPSLLPRWRGSAPIPYTILNGDTETGISIMHIRPSHFDQGPVILQETCPVSPHCTSLQLAKILAAKGGNLILEVLCNLPQHLEQAKAQSPNGATLASKLHPAMGYVDWAGQTCQQIHQQYRAFHELFPLRTEWCGSKVKLLHLVTSNAGIERGAACHLNTTTFHPGQPYYHKQSNTLYIRCQDGWVGFQRIVLRKPLTARDFDCGYLSKTPPNAAVFTSVQNGLFLTDDNNR